MNKSKTVKYFLWSFVNTGGSQLFGLIFGIFLARILSPEDFGSISIILFITLAANVFVDSGFSQALIREQDVKKLDYDSVFYFSLFVALICATLLYSLSEFLGNFYNNPVIGSLAKVMSISPLIYALMSVHATIITKALDFKLKAKLSLTAILISGLLAILMAKNGYGIWSLVVLQLLNPFLLMLFMWVKVKWRPELNFSYESIIKYIKFGIVISIVNLSTIIYTKSHVIMIGKYFSVTDAGYFSRADSLKNIPSGMLSKIIGRVIFPLLSKVQDDVNTLRNNNVKIIKFTSVISFPLMIGMASVSEELLVSLIGLKWLPASKILLYLCFAGVLLPLDTVNMNIIKVKGKMNTFLVIELTKLFLFIPVLYIGISIGMKEMLIAIIIHSVISFIASAIASGKIIKYKLLQYLKDIHQPLVFSLLMFCLNDLIQKYLNYNYFYELIISVISGIFIMVICYEIFSNNEYAILKGKIFRSRDGKK